MKINHIVETQQFTVPLLMELFDRADLMKKTVARGGTKDYDNKIMTSLFYQQSTRTRFAFESAMYRLGGKVLTTEQASLFSSEISGEHLEDTIQIIANYCDVIVLRHLEAGGAKRAAAVSPVPIINAGDGAGGQHPTQGLLDLYTIFSELHTLDGLSVAFMGSLSNGRTARSLAYLLSKFSRMKLYFVAPQEMQIKPDILEHLDENNVNYTVTDSLENIIDKIDVLYQTRFATERYPDLKFDFTKLYTDTHSLQKMKYDSIIMHPMPRDIEISHSVDTDPRAAYFRQAKNGLYIRMALLSMLFDGN